MRVRMQYIKQLLKLLILLPLLVGIGFSGFSLYIWLGSAEPTSIRSEDETRSNVQWLSSDKSLVFSFSPSRTHSIRVLSNAIFAQQLSLDKPVNYAIEYAFIDQQKQVISSHIYHHASKLTPLENEFQVKQIIEDRQALTVASGQSFYISPEQLKNVAAISLKLIPEDTQVMGVVVRVHAKTLNDNQDKNSTWLKLPLERRERATEYHSIGANALSMKEISNAVTYSWLKLAPQGIPSIDFKSDILYETLPYNVVTYDFSSQQLNLGDYYTDASLCASITLGEPDTLHFTKSAAITPILTWYDLNQYLPPKRVVVEQGANKPLSFTTEPLAAGLVTICSQEPLLTTWSLVSQQELTTAQDSYYLISEPMSARYDVEPNSDLAIELRSATRNAVTVSVLDQSNQVIDDFEVYYDGGISAFDRVILDSTQRQQVAQAKTFYLRVGKNAAAIKINSKHDALVRIKSRNSLFNYQRTVCHLNCFENETFHNIAAWYEQQASNHYIFSEKEMLVNIRVFAAPPEIEQKDTFYQSSDLSKQLSLSNVALVYSPDKYFLEPTEPSQFHFAKMNNKQLIQKSTNIKSTTPASIIYQLNKNTAKEIDLKDTDFEQLARVEDSSKTIYQNWQGERPWIKQRLYKLTANKAVTLNYPTLRPKSVVVKIYSNKENDDVVLNLSQHAKYFSGLKEEYSIAKKRYRLLPSSLSEAFLIHPKDSRLYSYPAITNQITADIQAIHSIRVTTDKDVWVAVLEEYSKEEVKVRWWNDDSL